MKGLEKAAAILSLLGEEISQKILSYLPEDAAVSVISASEKLKTPTKETLLGIVTEFNDYMAKSERKEAPAEMQGTEGAQGPLSKAPIDIISRATPQSLAKALTTERPEIAAYVLSHLPVEKIYETIQLLGDSRELVESKLMSIKDVPIAKELEEKVLKSISERLA